MDDGTQGGKTQHNTPEEGNQVVQKAMAAVQAVASRREQLLSRIPRVQSALSFALARVVALKWKHRVARSHGGAKVAYKDVRNARAAASSARFSALEIGEGLMNLVFELDGIATHGNQEVRAARKAQIVAAQAALPQADELKGKAVRIEAFINQVLEDLPVVQGTAGAKTEEEGSHDSVGSGSGASHAGGQPTVGNVTSHGNNSEDVNMAKSGAADIEVEGQDDVGSVASNGDVVLDTQSIEDGGDGSDDTRVCEDVHITSANHVDAEDTPMTPPQPTTAQPPNAPLRSRRESRNKRLPTTIPIQFGQSRQAPTQHSPSPRHAPRHVRFAPSVPTRSRVRRGRVPHSPVAPAHKAAAHQPRSRVHAPQDLYSNLFGLPSPRRTAVPRHHTRRANRVRSVPRGGYNDYPSRRSPGYNPGFGGFGGFGRSLFNTGFW